MTLDKAIEIYEKGAKLTWNGKPTVEAEECQQMAEWLKDYRRLLEQEPCDDCIRRSDIGLTNFEIVMCNGDYKEGLKMLVDKIEKAPSVTPMPKIGRWIPVSEMLPKAGECVGDVAKYYLVQNEYGDMLVARYTHSEYWQEIYHLQPCADEIVAWCELPEPYKL